MADRTVARRYAHAFLLLADEVGAVGPMGADLDIALQAARANDGELLIALGNPVFSSDERRAVLDALIPRLGLTQQVTANLLRLMVERGRFAVLPDLVEMYHQEADVLAGRLRVQVTTAEPLSDDLSNEIAAVLAQATGKQIVLEKGVDPTLIGGLVAQVGGKVYDASMRARLDDLKYRLIHGLPTAEA